MNKEELLAMKIGSCKKYDANGPESAPGSLQEIHRVFGGWIYIFKYTDTNAVIVSMSSAFVPEHLNVEAHTKSIW